MQKIIDNNYKNKNDVSQQKKPFSFSYKKDYIDLTGRKFGKLAVIKKVGEMYDYPYYECKCDCGNVINAFHFLLMKGVVRNCGCVEKKKKEIIGKRFGKLVVIKDTGRRKHNEPILRCKCDCGNTIETRKDNLLSGSTKSCGCLNSVDLTGKRFGKLVSLQRTNKRADNGSVIWQCQCDCGNMVDVSSAVLQSGQRKSCGCLKYPDLSGQKFGKLTVLEKTKKRYHSLVVYKCQCDCGTEIEVPSTQLKAGKIISCGCSRVRELTGQRFGNLTVVEKTYERIGGHVVWKCQCDCGEFIETSSHHLLSGDTKSCGCLKFEDLIGEKFGRLTVLERCRGEHNNNGTIWKCKCDCGKIIKASRNHLKNGDVKSCGCLRIKDLSGQRFHKLIAVAPTDKRASSGSVIWKCECDCGNITEAASDVLQKGEKKSCGCLSRKKQ